jgi:hypothetical protein
MKKGQEKSCPFCLKENEMFKQLSVLSKLFNKAVGIPEVNLNKLPFANKIVGDWEIKSMQDLVKQLPKETINRLIKVCNEELKNR